MIVLSLLPLLAAAPVIFVTLDGVRREDFVDTTTFQRLHAEPGRVVTHFAVATPTLISLPAYQSIFEGQLTACRSNNCARVSNETVLELIARKAKLKPEQVAVFASWKPIELAVARDPSAIYIDAGSKADDGPAPPWERARYDHATWIRAMQYWAEKRPRFLYISLNDADEWAHLGQREKYLAALKRYDAWLGNLLATEKEAVVIVTTDHGRGEGENWTEHGSRHPNAKAIWLWERGLPADIAIRTHLDLRPAFEKLFGL